MIDLKTGKIIKGDNKTGHDTIHCADGNIHIWGSFCASINPNKKELRTLILVLRWNHRQNHSLQKGSYTFSINSIGDTFHNIDICFGSGMITLTLERHVLFSLANYLEENVSDFDDEQLSNRELAQRLEVMANQSCNEPEPYRTDLVRLASERLKILHG